MVSLMNGSFPTRLGLHLLDTKERGACQKGLGQLACAFRRPVSAHLVTRLIFCIFDHGTLQLWALDVVISASKLSDLYA
jgi:hypothetical protein